jgi:SAM-dependent methyltransferase
MRSVGIKKIPYPVSVRRRTANVLKGPKEGLAVFDSPEAQALNAARMSHLEGLGLPLSGKRVLDVGCGVGHLAARLAGMNCNVFCIDGRAENIQSLRARYPQLQAEVADVEKDRLSRFGKFDVVFSFGLLYHVSDPLHVLRNMESVCGELLLLETIISDHKLPLVRVLDEGPELNEALGGLGCRPTPSYVVLALNQIGLPHVYAPLSPPRHEDFQFEWLNNLDCSRDEHPIRAVFVASRTELSNPLLVSLLRD